ncbi:hypothetical protein SEA_SMOOCH_103 [Mycobacterium phage Smooch]|uniref:Uncharacterized protein n=1 Tax=Mycobacterium phage Smooch TaxID=2652896 RepID=A0A5P8DC64_BPMCO|nr:hypothetical protein SEA_SMOOCH_103 [Mycobacterium phage Smooch]
MRRHTYKADPHSEGVCLCGEARSQDVHDRIVWRRSVRDGLWYSGPVNGVQYRCYSRLRTRASWKAQFSTEVVGGQPQWKTLGPEHEIVTLDRAKAICEEHRESLEVRNG